MIGEDLWLREKWNTPSCLKTVRSIRYRMEDVQ